MLGELGNASFVSQYLEVVAVVWYNMARTVVFPEPNPLLDQSGRLEDECYP